MSKLPTPARLDPLAIDDLTDFQPSPAAKPKVEAIRAVSEASNFPSRAAPKPQPEPAPSRSRRWHRTGRTVQINMKAKPETVAQLNRIADLQGWSLVATFEHALNALDEKIAKG